MPSLDARSLHGTCSRRGGRRADMAAVMSAHGVCARTKERGLSVVRLGAAVVVLLTGAGATGIGGVAVRVEVREKGA